MVLILSFLIAQDLNAQTSYMVNGPLPASGGPLLNTQSDNSTSGFTNFHAYNAGAGATTNTWSQAEAIGFPFQFYGTSVTHFCVSKNFLLTFDTTVANTTATAAISSGNTSLPNADLPPQTIAYFWGTFANKGSNDNVWRRTFGTAPNRQLWIQNYSYAMEGRSFSYNFMVLEETTNKVYVVDGYAGGGTGTWTVVCTTR